MVEDDNGLYRFIPMCIGNTSSTITNAGNISVYPYVYREHIEVAKAGDKESGLSLCV